MFSRMPHTEPVVFVVDDDVSVRESLELLLRSVGLHTRVFGSAEAFLAYPKTDVPCCVVLDVSLPDVSGLDLQQRIASERFRVPTIFISGHDDIPLMIQAMKAGAVEFLVKPFDDEKLLDAVRHALDQSRAALDDATKP